MKKVLKRSLSVFLVITIIFSSAYIGLGEIDFGCLFAVEAKAASDNDLIFKLDSGGKTYSVADCDESASGEIVIPSTYKGLPVTSIGDDAFSNCTNLISIVVSDSVTSIGDYAFYSCESFTSITIPDSVTTIGIYAFCRCKSLTSITIPDSVTSIGEWAFNGCRSLTSITIPDSVTSIGGAAFSTCKALTSVTIGDSVTTIGMFTFSNCTSLTSITISDSVTSIGDYAFEECTSLTDVFYSGSESDWDDIAIGSNNEPLINATIHCAIDSEIFEYTIENNTVTITGYTGTDTDVVIPSTIDGLPVTSIGERAFYDCTSLTSVTIPDSITSIGDGAFYACINLASVTIGNGVTSIGFYAFGECYSLTSITIPASVTRIVDSAFYNCTNLNSINVSSDNLSFSSVDGVLFDKDKTTLVLYPIGKTIASYTIPDSVTSIGYGAFYACTNLASVTIGNGVTSIGDNAFYGCYGLRTITIPDSVTSIGNSAFEDCFSLTSIKLPEKITSIEFSTFYRCTSLSSITIPDSVTSIGSCAFGECHSLTSITIPYGVTSIGDSAFSGCTSLSSIIIPAGVTSVGWRAFEFCESLTAVFYSGAEKDWADITIDLGNQSLTDAFIHYNSTEHIDSAEWRVAVAPTCTEDGLKLLDCTVCGYNFSSESIPAVGHSESDWMIDKKATCSQAGSKHKECTVCGIVVETAEIPSNGHTTVIDEAVAPTCTEIGITEGSHCSVCNTVIVAQSIIPATGHSYGGWVITTEPTCTKEGSRSKTCSACGDVVTEVVSVTGHSYSDEWTIDVEATCMEDGSKSHHCSVCGDKTDVTVITATGHDYKVISSDTNHPHTITYKCTSCGDEKNEVSGSSNCIECNFTITAINQSSYKLVSYTGIQTDVVIPGTHKGCPVTTIANGCFKGNKAITSIDIPYGVTTIGSLAFMNCTSLEKVIIPASVTSIGTQAFYGFKGTIYCTKDSFVHEYAINNNISYVLLSIVGTENTQIDYDNFVIKTTVQNADDITEILGVSETAIAIAIASYTYGDIELCGTGTIVTVFDGDDYIGDFTLIVNGDTNGDSVCDALDIVDVERASNGNAELDDVYALAADSNSDDMVDITDYQAIVNKALAS